MCLGVPGEIVAIETRVPPTAIVDVSGVRRQVNLACVLDEQSDPARLLGQWVLVHVGFAMSLIDPAEAQRTLALLAELDACGDAAEEAPDALR